MKQRIRLTESQLHNVIKESVKQILKEIKGLHGYYEPESGSPSDKEKANRQAATDFRTMANARYYLRHLVRENPRVVNNNNMQQMYDDDSANSVYTPYNDKDNDAIDRMAKRGAQNFINNLGLPQDKLDKVDYND